MIYMEHLVQVWGGIGPVDKHLSSQIWSCFYILLLILRIPEASCSQIGNRLDIPKVKQDAKYLRLPTFGRKIKGKSI